MHETTKGDYEDTTLRHSMKIVVARVCFNQL